jgi:hypothetical protein
MQVVTIRSGHLVLPELLTYTVVKGRVLRGPFLIRESSTATLSVITTVLECIVSILDLSFDPFQY